MKMPVLDTMEIREGTVLADRYSVISRLGSGGMATVYLAEDDVLGRRVAVKRMRSDGRTADAERFRREARLGATLSHPNVVTVFDTIAGEDGVLIVMEYVPGETLADVIDRGRVEPERAIEILEGVGSALDHAHSHGIVHRDVKPANVLLAGNDGAVKLTDLGIATAAESTRITAANDIVGTLAYISPERLGAESPGGPESDVYSLAVLAWETLSGEQLNRGSTPAEVLHRAANAPPPDLRDAWPEAPAALAGVLQDAMDPDPARRPGSAGEFVARLREALDSQTELEPVSDPTETMTAPTAIAPDPPRAPAEVLYDRLPTADGTPPQAHAPAPIDRAPRGLLLALAGLALAGLAALAIAALGGGDETDSGGGQVAGAERQGGDGGSEEPAPAETAPEEPAETTEEPAVAGDDPAALNQQGFDLIQAGDYDGAIPILQRAVDSYPEGSQDLEYAYALFNLGNALRLAGRPEEAIPVLEERLAIPNQTETVQRELDLARADAGYAPAPDEKPAKPPKEREIEAEE